MHATTWQNHHAESKNLDTEEYTLFDSIHKNSIKCKPTHSSSKEISGFLRLEAEEGREGCKMRQIISRGQ